MASVTNSAGVEVTYGTYNQKLKNEVIREPKTSWDQDMFLKVLVAQMSNQDPMNPQSDTEFIGQMAQFSSLEQMTKLNNSMQQMQAYNLVGKYVAATYDVPLNDGTDNTVEKTVVGKVDSTFTQSGITYLVVNIPVKDAKGNPVKDVDGNFKIDVYNIPMADVDEVIDPGLYDDSVLNDDKILAKLDELINLLKAQQAGEAGEEGDEGEAGTNEENKTNANEGV